MTLPPVFVCSLAALSFEVLLTRLFAVTQWNHLSFVAVAVAMLGYAASGVLAQARRDARGEGRLLASALALLPLVFLAAFQVASGTRLDYFQLAIDPMQLVRLALLFVALACPFLLAGFVTAVAYARLAPARVYLASMAGSALGALAPAALLPAVGLTRAFVLVALLPVAPALLRARALAGAAERRVLLGLAAAPVALGAFFIVFPSLVEARPNAYKAFSHYSAMAGVTVVSRHENLRARYDEVAGEPVRFAPGLSLRYTDSLPAERLIFEDGDRGHLLPDVEDPRTEAFARSLLASGAYAAAERAERVLILHADGGTSAVVAAAAGARSIDLLTDQGYLARRFAGHYGGRLSRVVFQSARSFLAAPGPQYDVIQVESWGTQLPAMASLAEDRWITVQGLRAMLSRLAPGGILAFNRALDLPPTDLLRLLATAWKALGVSDPAACTAVLRSWDSLLLVVAKEPLSEQALARLRAFARRLRFDPVLMPGLTEEESNRYNQMARPYHFEAASALAAGTLDRSSPFDVSPLTDARPFPYHYLRWGRLPAAWRLLADRLYSLMLSGEVMLLLLLVTAVAASALMLLLPARLARSGERASAPAPAGAALPLRYFVAIGAGYMLCEIGWIEVLGLLLESPSLAFSVAVGGMLLASGPGGMIGERSRLRLRAPAAAALAATGLAAGLALGARWLLPLPAWGRAAAALVALLPCGLLLGIPFPLGLRLADAAGGCRARAWAANGAAGVVASVLAPLVAMTWGVPALLACAAACYGGALAAAGRPAASSAKRGGPSGSS